MTEPEIYDSLAELFSEIFLRDDIVLTAQTSARDVEGWDSFKQIEIVMAVEERFNIKMLTREMDGLKNVGDLVSVIEKKISS
jgi:acyl carrier protein